MAETSNIAQMAVKVSTEIFEVLGWNRVGPYDQNWTCVTESHDVATHPTDVVFAYDDPYRNERILWNVDLKSYAANTINKSKLSGAIVSLVKTVQCAATSKGWSDLYGDDESNWRCDGMLFVYNHDGEFDRNFGQLLASVENSHLKLQRGRRLAILGPADISYLVNVTSDIIHLRGREVIPIAKDSTEFWYPDLVRPKHRAQPTSAATIEMVTGPWVTLQIHPQSNGEKRRFLVYYREDGSTVEEFVYLIDSFFRFQMLSVDREAAIDVRLVSPCKEAITNFAKAKSRIASTLYGLTGKRLEAVRCETIQTVVRRFGEIEIGMEER